MCSTQTIAKWYFNVFFDTLASLGTKSDSTMCRSNQQLDQNEFGSHVINKEKLNHTYRKKGLYSPNPWCLGIGSFVCSRPIQAISLHYLAEFVRQMGPGINHILFASKLCSFSQHSTLVDLGLKTWVKQCTNTIRMERMIAIE